MTALVLEAMHVRFKRAPPNIQLCSSQNQGLSLSMIFQYDVFQRRLVQGFSTVHTMLCALNFGMRRAIKAYKELANLTLRRFTPDSVGMPNGPKDTGLKDTTVPQVADSSASLDPNKLF